MTRDKELFLFARRLPHLEHHRVDPWRYYCEHEKWKDGSCDGASHKIVDENQPFTSGSITFLCDECYEKLMSMGQLNKFV